MGKKRFDYITSGCALFEKGEKNLVTFGRGLSGTSVTVKRGRLTVEIIISAGCLFARINFENRKNEKVDKSSVNIHLTTLSDKLFIYKSLTRQKTLHHIPLVVFEALL